MENRYVKAEIRAEWQKVVSRKIYKLRKVHNGVIRGGTALRTEVR
jgi:hypothetical protein